MSTPTDSTARPADRDAASRENPFRYTATLADELELRWQARWEESRAFRTPNPGDTGFDASKPKFYCLDMFPYPSGAGLHVGHPEGYTATDIICRYKRMTGHNVLHPMGWDAFGLPAEQYAIQTGVHPAVTTRSAIENFRRQLKRFGFSYDWEREFATIDPGYYKWTQWIWLKAYHAWFDPIARRGRHIDELVTELENGAFVVGADDELLPADGAPSDARAWTALDDAAQRTFIDAQRLAYLGEQTVNWCPKLGTALANEEVIDGRSERGGHPVFRKPLKQWMFRITAYADRLEADLDAVQWPESTRTMQREWIGRSEGAEVDFPIADPPTGDMAALRVYTTRPDTIFGATYMVIAPEHPLVDAVLAHPAPETDPDAVRAYVETAKNRADVERMADNKEKTGVATGCYAVNPATGALVPIWIADYVLMGYGHGAIMAVPAHDQRDFDFARAFDLPIVDVVHTIVHDAIDAYQARAGARPDDVDADTSLNEMADFIGLAMNTRQADLRDAADAAAQSTIWDQIWSLVDTRRAGGGVPPSGTKERRGSILRIWRETLETFSPGAPNPLIEAIRTRTFASFTNAAIVESGRSVNSANDEVDLNGLQTDDAKARIIAWFEARGIGRRSVNYRLRDWLFSRQRYWGEPFPIVYDAAGNHYPVGERALPVTLPDLADYAPVESDDPLPLLGKATEWTQTTAGAAGVDPAVLPPDTPVTRETNTMPGWAGSCWYYLRYCDPHNSERFVSREAERYWMLSARGSAGHGTTDASVTYSPELHHVGGVDLYVGGAEHAVLHLLYARFWHKLLFDLGELNTPEPFGRLFHQGMITSYAYQRPDKTLVPVDEVSDAGDDAYVEDASGQRVARITAKMSKSLRNVINPDDIIEAYGADTFRLYEMYMGPLDASKPWNTQDIQGPFRFLQRAWRLLVDEDTNALTLVDDADEKIEKLLHRTIDKVGGDIERLAFNTAIAAMIEFVNAAGKAGGLSRSQAERFTLILAPFAPHLGEELWARLGHETFAMHTPWPTVDASMLTDDTVEMPVQINGKVRGRIQIAADASQADVEEAARANDRIGALLDGAEIRKVIVVPGKIINIIL